MPARKMRFMTGSPLLSIASNSRAMDSGSATPEHSTTRRSHCLSSFETPVLCTNSSRRAKRSSRPEQQAQPFCSPTMPSASSNFKTSESMFASAISLTTTPTFMFSRFLKMCPTSVVLPAPRKPVKIDTGTFARAFLEPMPPPPPPKPLPPPKPMPSPPRPRPSSKSNMLAGAKGNPAAATAKTGGRPSASPACEAEPRLRAPPARAPEQVRRTPWPHTDAAAARPSSSRSAGRISHPTASCLSLAPSSRPCCLASPRRCAAPTCVWPSSTTPTSGRNASE
mmetsp:Transcript_2662/g.10349  ORF Transcript_2662/g.10349 Transcript_2662/m.10349 type:complete len:281 (+) Transcript_2662:1067-1909(+)